MSIVCLTKRLPISPISSIGGIKPVYRGSSREGEYSLASNLGATAGEHEWGKHSFSELLLVE